MADMSLKLTAVKRKFEDYKIIISKLNLKGYLTYVNNVFHWLDKLNAR